MSGELDLYSGVKEPNDDALVSIFEKGLIPWNLLPNWCKEYKFWGYPSNFPDSVSFAALAPGGSYHDSSAYKDSYGAGGGDRSANITIVSEYADYHPLLENLSLVSPWLWSVADESSIKYEPTDIPCMRDEALHESVFPIHAFTRILVYGDTMHRRVLLALQKAEVEIRVEQVPPKP